MANEKPRLLLVDDNPDNLMVLHGLLQENYRTILATNGEDALALCQKEQLPELILLDVMMPGMDGYSVCEKLKTSPRTADIPVIFLTARMEKEAESKGFLVGGVDYITKPFSPPVLKARVETHLALKQTRDALKDQNALLEERVEQRTRSISSLQDAIIMAMASLAETRDNETGNHLRRTQWYVRLFAEQLSLLPQYKDRLTAARISLLYKSAPLHDIGKVGVPDRILLKPGKLTEEEFIVMKRHTEYGRDAIIAAEQSLAGEDTFLSLAKEIAFGHHEKWDGSGYPQGLSGDAIPLSARLMALADVYDALISKRVYKPAFSHEKARGIILEGRGTHFDPQIVDAFLAVEDEVRRIAAQLAD